MLSAVVPSCTRRLTALLGGLALALCLAGVSRDAAAAAVYKWIDASGVTHLSSEKPPAGVKFERLSVASTPSSTRVSGAARNPGVGGNTRVSATNPAQTARRNDTVNTLRTRECVMALETLDRLARNGQAVEPAEFTRLQQTADLNCSKDPAERRQQEEQAARLRVSRGDTCVAARDKLAAMLDGTQRPSREQLQTQQEFIESHCTAPVR
jgi:hypothetical protein